MLMASIDSVGTADFTAGWLSSRRLCYVRDALIAIKHMLTFVIGCIKGYQIMFARAIFARSRVTDGCGSMVVSGR
jgi:hypothetical protein